jgi:hypothetical protein
MEFKIDVCRSNISLISWISVAILILLSACGANKNLVEESTITDEVPPPLETFAPVDKVSPTPGEDGQLALSDIQQTRVTVSWAPASDNLTRGSNLLYSVFYSETDNLITLEDAINTGIKVADKVPGLVTKEISNLKVGTTYFFQVFVFDQAENTAAYHSKSVATLGDTLAPVAGNSGILTPSAIGAYSMTLSWDQASDDFTSSSKLSYALYRSLTTSMNTLAEVEAGVLVKEFTVGLNSFNLTNLVPGTIYFFNVVVRDDSGNKSIYQKTVGTTINDITPPTPAGSLSFAAVTDVGLLLSWQSATDDNPLLSGNLSYRVYQSSSNNISTIANAVANGTPLSGFSLDTNSLSINSLTPATTYYFVVIVRDSANNQAIYTVASQATLQDTTPPIPGNSGVIASSNIASQTVDLYWTPATDNGYSPSALKYAVYRSSSNNMTSVANTLSNGTLLAGNLTNASTYSVSSLSPSTTYFFNVLVQDAASSPNSAIYNSVSITTTADAVAPIVGSSGSIGVSSQGLNQLTLSWTIATDNITPQSSLQYQVYVSELDNLSTVSAATTNGSPFGSYTANINTMLITGLMPATEYWFQVIVRDLAGNRTAYVSTSGTTTTDMTAPNPGNSGAINVVSFDTTSIQLGWTAATDNGFQPNQLSYKVYLSSVENIDSVASVIANGSLIGTYLDGTNAELRLLTPNSVYYYNVLVSDPAGNNSVYVMGSQATQADSFPPIPGNSGTLNLEMGSTSANVSWEKSMDETSSQSSLRYRLYRSTSNNIQSVSEMESNGTPVGSLQTDMNNFTTPQDLTSGVTYWFNVLVMDEAGNKGAYTSLSGEALMDYDAPIPGNSGLINSSGISPAGFTLTWDPATDNYTPQENIRYSVVVSTSPNLTDANSALNNGSILMSFTANTHSMIVSGLAPNQTYWINVVVQDNSLNQTVYIQRSISTLADTVAPIPGSIGVLSFTNRQKTSIKVNWTQGTDLWTHQNQLQYEIYRSNSDNISTIADAKSNGTLVQPYTAAISDIVISGLSAKSTYYIAVLVKDLGGNEATYLSAPAKTATRAHIAYQDVTNVDLRYWTDTSGSPVDQAIETSGSTGTHPDIHLDGSNIPFVIFARGATSGAIYTSNKSSGSWSAASLALNLTSSSHLSFERASNGRFYGAFYRGTSGTRDLLAGNNDSGTWTSLNLDTPNSVGTFATSKLDSTGWQHIAYYDATNLDLRYTRFKVGQSVQAPVVVDSTGSVGTYSKILVDSTDRAHILYFDATNTALKYATNASGSWVVTTLQSPTTTDNMGNFVTAVIDGSNNLHVFYANTTASKIMYMKKDSASGGWSVPEQIHSSNNMRVNLEMSAAFGSDGLVHLVLHENTTQDLVYAYGERGSWKTEVIASTGSTGRYPSIALEP